MSYLQYTLKHEQNQEPKKRSKIAKDTKTPCGGPWPENPPQWIFLSLDSSYFIRIPIRICFRVGVSQVILCCVSLGPNSSSSIQIDLKWLDSYHYATVLVMARVLILNYEFIK
jgi:hypothetical protein